MEGTGFEPSVPLSRQGLSALADGRCGTDKLDGGRRRAPGFRVPGWLLRLGVRCLTGGSNVGYILSAGRADVKRLRQLEHENGRLKKMVADRELELDVLKEITRKKW